MIKKQLVTSVLIMGCVISSSAFAEILSNTDPGGAYTGTYYSMIAKGTVKKGHFIDESNDIPYPTNSETVKIATNCILRIDGYDATAKIYGYTLICHGANGWEITGWTSKGDTLAELNDGKGSIGYDYSDFAMVSTDASFWTSTTWVGSDPFYIIYGGPAFFTAKKDKSNNVTSVTTDGFKDGFLSLYDQRGTTAKFSSLKSGVTVKFIKSTKLDSDAVTCFTQWDANAAGVNPPCDPINN